MLYVGCVYVCVLGVGGVKSTIPVRERPRGSVLRVTSCGRWMAGGYKQRLTIS